MLTRRIRVVPVHAVAGEASRGADAVPHAVDHQLRPALAPQIAGRLDRVDGGDHRRQLFEPPGNAAVHLADPVDLVMRGALRHGAANPPRRVELGGEQGRDGAHGPIPADDRGDALLVHAVLQRDDIAVGRQVLPDQGRRPLRVIGFDRDHRDVDRLFLGQLLHFGQMHRLWPGEDEFLLGHPFDRQPVAADRLDMFGPGIDQGHVEPVMRELAAGVAADGASADHRNPLRHDLIPL